MADNLLDKASILLTPTAYDNGSMLSIKPENGDGDFQFERNSAATRVNAQGLVENVQIISSELVSNGNFSQIGTEEVLNGNFSQEGSELITNGDFATDSDWTKGTGWTISGGSANYDGVNAYELLRQGTANGVVGKTYLVKYDVINNSGVGGIYAKFGGVNLSGYNQNNGSFEFYITAVSTDYIRFTPQLNFTGSIDNVSVKEVGQNWELDTGWSIGEDKAVLTNVGYNINCTQSNVTTIGQYYKIEFTISDYINGQIRISLGGNATSLVSANGTYVFYLQATINNVLTLQPLNASGTNLSITNISVKEVGQDWATNDPNITIQGGYASFNSPNTYTRLTNTPTINIVQGRKYKVKCTVTNYISGACYFRMPFNNAIVDRIEQGGEYELISVADNNYSNIVIASATSNAAMDITNISVKEITDDTNIPRINYEGFSYQDSLGSELVVNGDFSVDSNWNKDNSWTISEGAANYNYISGRNMNSASVSLVIGKSYKLVYTVLNYSSGYVINDSAETRPQRNSNGTYTEVFTARYTFFRLKGSVGGIFSIDNVSVKEVTGQEVVPDSGCGSWLLEPQSTNLITYSEDFSDSSWVKNGFGSALSPVVTLNSDISPDGTQNSSRIEMDCTSTSSSDYSAIYQQLALDGSSEYTISFYVKSNTSSEQDLLFFSNSSFSTQITANSEWQRVESTFTSNSTNTRNFGLVARGSVQQNIDILVWGAQLENQSHATSYIPTNGAANTRLQDIANNSGNSSLINSTEGVLYGEGYFEQTGLTNGLFAISDGTFNNLLMVRYSPINKLQIESTGGVNIIETSTRPSGNYKIAVKYSSSGVELWVNGSKIEETSTVSTMSGVNQLMVGKSPYGNIVGYENKEVAVFPILTDAELQSLTTI